MYTFLADHLGLDLTAIRDPQGEISEAFVTILSKDDLAVFDTAHPRPSYAETKEDRIVPRKKR